MEPTALVAEVRRIRRDLVSRARMSGVAATIKAVNCSGVTRVYAGFPGGRQGSRLGEQF